MVQFLFQVFSFQKDTIDMFGMCHGCSQSESGVWLSVVNCRPITGQCSVVYSSLWANQRAVSGFLRHFFYQLENSLWLSVVNCWPIREQCLVAYSSLVANQRAAFVIYSTLVANQMIPFSFFGNH